MRRYVQVMRRSLSSRSAAATAGVNTSIDGFASKTKETDKNDEEGEVLRATYNYSPSEQKPSKSNGAQKNSSKEEKTSRATDDTFSSEQKQSNSNGTQKNNSEEDKASPATDSNPSTHQKLSNPNGTHKKNSNAQQPENATNMPTKPISRGCPFKARRGYVDARSDYLFHFYRAVDDDDTVTEDANLPTKSLVASTHLADPLYFWQLYSLIGPKPIIALVTHFYECVFADKKNPWFRDAFIRVAPLEHHINTQAAYWIDAFGGGKYYHGGNYRVTFHHRHNARSVMNAKGATRWMYHMTKILIAAKEKRVFQEDPRVIPCIVDFLEAKMRTYAMDNDWIFDASDFTPLREAFNHTIEVKSG